MNAQEHDPILAADKREEMEARMALRMARDKTDLIAAWWLNAEHFDGEARIRLQDIFDECLAKIRKRLQ